VPGTEEVVDLVGAVWLEVIVSLDRFEPAQGDVLPWILGIAANLCATERRRQQCERDVVQRLGGRRLLEDDDFARLEREIDAAAVAPRLRRALASFPPSERAVAELGPARWADAAQAADALQTRPAAVRMRLTRARRKLLGAPRRRRASAPALRAPV
jgi:RNA polymerase sigma factor (sigma-70 family)